MKRGAFVIKTKLMIRKRVMRMTELWIGEGITKTELEMMKSLTIKRGFIIGTRLVTIKKFITKTELIIRK
jgi:hypothetical protein